MKHNKKNLLIVPMLFLSIIVQAKTTFNLSCHRMSTRYVLNWLAHEFNKNVIVDDAINGSVTLDLKQVSYNEALNVILLSKKLVKKQVGNMTYVEPYSNLQQFQQLLDIDNDRADAYRVIALKYAKAADLKKLLDKRKQKASIVVDERTNTLIVQTAPEHMQQLFQLVKRLDVPTQQVLIRARIVSVDDSYEREFGVRFGITSGNHFSGTLEGANDLAKGVSSKEVDVAKRLAVNLPATSSQAGHFGLALAKIASRTTLDLELSALESKGLAEIIAAPNLLMANRKSASIEAGEEIPYQESAGEGATSTSFKKAVLKLLVTPQITPNKRIVLKLSVNQDKRGSQEVKGEPTIDTNHLDSEVIVSSGQTVVLGGLYEQTQTYGVEGIPLLSDIPGLGVLFRHKKTINQRRELLVFITPEIVSLDK
ncbi:MAG: type IV pilus secretin PilQ [Pseudomonadota bacterium]|nr:type IV pilus secretin PilQ [Gammaproteobacteria bacterium]MBU1558546.1 type IV pilus secretin PilQ [Gammaproteobacteria bacterium]MBU1628566.1 type IV pilus secretin PilQ [Gammaproteobacteria bacterium]MBU2545578.1 type IV pilus secretin PilQ [Gammaproteobacteria bacterium]